MATRVTTAIREPDLSAVMAGTGVAATGAGASGLAAITARISPGSIRFCRSDSPPIIGVQLPYYYYDDGYYLWDPSYNGYVATDPPPVASTEARRAAPTTENTRGLE